MATSIYDSTGRQIARVGSAARAGFNAATAGLDQYGPEVNVHPFAANEIPDRASGIARIVSEMIGSRRAIANARELRQRRETHDEYDRLQLAHLQQVVTGTVPKASHTGPATDQPISADLAKKYKLTSFVPDPNDPTGGTANIHEINTASIASRAQEVGDRVTKRGEAVDERIRELANQRLQARSKVAEQDAALRDLDMRAKIEGDTAANITRSKIEKELPWLTMQAGRTPAGQPMDQAAFWARRKQAAEFLGAGWKTKDGEPVYLDSDNTLHAFDVPNRDRLNMMIEESRASAASKFQTTNMARRTAIQLMRDKYLHMDTVLAGMKPGGQTGEGNIDQWNADPLNTPAPPPETPEQPQYEDPMGQLKKWDEEDDGN